MKETEESSINPYHQTQSKVKSEPRGRQIKLKLEAKSCKLTHVLTKWLFTQQPKKNVEPNRLSKIVRQPKHFNKAHTCLEIHKLNGRTYVNGGKKILFAAFNSKMEEYFY